MKTIAKRVAASLCTIIMSFNFASFAYASPATEARTQCNVECELAKTTISQAKDIHDVEVRSKLVTNTKALLKSAHIKTHYQDAKLNWSEPSLLEFDTDNGTFRSITLQIQDPRYSILSNITAVFDSSWNISNYAEQLLSKTDNNKFLMQVYMNGDLVNQQVSDFDFISNEDIQKKLDEYASLPQTQGWGEEATCLTAVLGVDVAVAWIILGTCTTACAAQPIAAPVCAACIGAVAAMGAANVGGVIACFGLL